MLVRFAVTVLVDAFEELEHDAPLIADALYAIRVGSGQIREAEEVLRTYLDRRPQDGFRRLNLFAGGTTQFLVGKQSNTRHGNLSVI